MGTTINKQSKPDNQIVKPVKIDVDGPRIYLRSVALLIFAISLTSLLLTSCFTDETVYPGNKPPQTFLSVQAESLRIANYRTIINWWGTDQDGHVIGYAYRWDGPWEPEPEDRLWGEDSSWVFTEATNDTFDVPVIGTYAERTFSIKAIDNNLLADPEPKHQTFRLTNFKPIVNWSDTTRHPTFDFPSLEAISFAWTPEDYDGRGTIKFARLWLDTIDGEDPELSTITVASDTVGAFFPEHFQGRVGERTVYMQVYDRSMTPSDTISWTWLVVEPQGEYLLIDNAWPYRNSAADKQDNFWKGRMDALYAGNYHVYDVETQGVFRSAQEVLPIFQLFKGVVWYGIKYYSNEGGSSAVVDEAMKTGLTLAENSLIPYAESGGKVVISAHNIFGTNAGLSDSFAEDEFGVKEIYHHFDANADADISDGMLPRLVYVQSRGNFGDIDSLKVKKNLSNVDYFDISSRLTPLLWIDLNTLPDGIAIEDLPEETDDEVYVAAKLEDPSGGSVTIMTSLLTEFDNRSDPAGAVESFLRSLFDSPDGK